MSPSWSPVRAFHFSAPPPPPVSGQELVLWDVRLEKMRNAVVSRTQKPTVSERRRVCASEMLQGPTPVRPVSIAISGEDSPSPLAVSQAAQGLQHSTDLQQEQQHGISPPSVLWLMAAPWLASHRTGVKCPSGSRRCLEPFQLSPSSHHLCIFCDVLGPLTKCF